MGETNLDWRKQETYKSMMMYGQGMLRFTFLVNGGSIIAILTFVGNLAAKGVPIMHMTWAIAIFLIGVLFAGLAAGTAYMAQFALLVELDKGVEGKGWRSHMSWVNLTILLLALSLISFAVGALTAIVELG